MKTKKTITVCFKDNTSIQEKTNAFKTNDFRLNDSLNFEPLFNIEEKNTDNGDLMFSTYNEMSEEEKKLYRIYKVDVDLHPELAIRYQVRSIPTLTLFKEGKEIGSHMGLIKAEELKTLIDEST